MTAAFPLLLSGFEYRRMDVDGVAVNCAVRGSGPPVLLLHGYPQNHLMWRHVAPALARDHTVVVPEDRVLGSAAGAAESTLFDPLQTALRSGAAMGQRSHRDPPHRRGTRQRVCLVRGHRVLLAPLAAGGRSVVERCPPGC